MALSNAARQQRFRQRAAYMASLQPRDVLVRACVASGIAALSFCWRAFGQGDVRLFPNDSGRRPASIAVVGLLR
jgi:hypothetical protein